MSEALLREPWWVSALRDGLRIGLLAVIVGAVLAAVILPPAARWAWLDVPGRILAGWSTELLAIVLLRAAVPVARPGAHRVGWNRDYLRWVASSTLNEVAMLPAVRAPFAFVRVGRILYFKALGARLPWSVSLPDDLTLRDPSLCVVGAGTQLEPGVAVETALHGAGRVRVHPVVIGSGCLVGAQTVMLPGAVIAYEARVGPRCLLGEDARIGVGATVEAGVHLDRAADVGSYAVIGSGALVGASSRVGDRARVGAGAVVAAGVVVGERARWGPSPDAPHQTSR